MNKAQLKKEQPVVYRTLSNALKSRHIANAYLFCGPKGTPKSEMALLMAQSLFCQHTDEDGFACQSCAACRQTENGNNLDVQILRQEKISRKDIVAIQDYFSSSSISAGHERLYIIEDFDLARKDASNALLKFLEEPLPHVHAILTSASASSVLPTIASRAQILHFRPVMARYNFEAMQEFCDERHAQILSGIGYTPAGAKELFEQSEQFEKVEEAILAYMKDMGSDLQILHMQQVFASKSALLSRPWIRLALEWILYEIRQGSSIYTPEQNAKIRMILVSALDKVNLNIDLALMLDQTYFEIRKVVRS
jgi:DNA polymerase-3 subunit delta'